MTQPKGFLEDLFDSYDQMIDHAADPLGLGQFYGNVPYNPYDLDIYGGTSPAGGDDTSDSSGSFWDLF